MSARGGSAIIHIARLLSGVILAMHSRREASEQNNESPEEEQDHSCQDRPHADWEVRMRSGSVAVDVILDDAEGDEIGGHDDDGYNPWDGCDCCSEDGAAETRADGEEEGDECEAGGDGVEDHDSSEGFGGVDWGGGESCMVDPLHDDCGVVADDLGVAEILIGPVTLLLEMRFW